jgi:hypothetical protein
VFDQSIVLRDHGERHRRFVQNPPHLPFTILDQVLGMPLLTDVAEQDHEPAARQRLSPTLDDAAVRKHALGHIRLIEGGGQLARCSLNAG